MTHADPAVAGSRGAPQRGPALAADQDRRPRLLERLGLERNGVEVEELPVVRHLGLGPQPLAHLDRLVDTPASRREVEADRPPLLLEPAGADPELDPPTRQEVERLHGACRDERVAQTEVVHVSAEANTAGPRGEEAEVRERVEHRRRGRHGWVLVPRVG